MAVLNDDDLDRQMMLQQLEQAPRARRRGMPYEQGGVTGNTSTLDEGLAPEPPGVTPQIDPPAAAAQSYNMRGFDAGKLSADPSQQSERYKMGNIFKKYDPKGGVTPEMLAELNALGIAEFSGSGDKLSVKNTKNDPRFGSGGTGDVIYAHDAQNQDTAWQPWFVDEGGGAGLPSQSSAASYAGGGGSSMGNLQSLVPTDMDFFNKLQAQLQEILGGQSAFDRNALLRMLGAG